MKSNVIDKNENKNFSEKLKKVEPKYGKVI